MLPNKSLQHCQEQMIRATMYPCLKYFCTESKASLSTLMKSRRQYSILCCNSSPPQDLPQTQLGLLLFFRTIFLQHSSRSFKKTEKESTYYTSSINGIVCHKNNAALNDTGAFKKRRNSWDVSWSLIISIFSPFFFWECCGFS